MTQVLPALSLMTSCTLYLFSPLIYQSFQKMHNCLLKSLFSLDMSPLCFLLCQPGISELTQTFMRVEAVLTHWQCCFLTLIKCRSHFLVNTALRPYISVSEVGGFCPKSSKKPCKATLPGRWEGSWGKVGVVVLFNTIAPQSSHSITVC